MYNIAKVFTLTLLGSLEKKKDNLFCVLPANLIQSIGISVEDKQAKGQSCTCNVIEVHACERAAKELEDRKSQQ